MTTLVSPAALPDDLSTILRRIEYLERWTAGLGAAIQTAVGPTVADLKDQVARLADAQAQIAALVSSQVVPATTTGVESGFAWTVGWTDHAPVSVPVPAGYTRAAVVALGSAVAVSPTGAFVELIAAVRINGTAGATSSTTLAQVTSANASSVSVAAATTLAGLTPGAVVTAAVTGYATNTNANGVGGINRAVTTLVCTFQR